MSDIITNPELRVAMLAQADLRDKIQTLMLQRTHMLVQQNGLQAEFDRLNDELVLAKSALHALNTKIYSLKFNVTIE